MVGALLFRIVDNKSLIVGRYWKNAKIRFSGQIQATLRPKARSGKGANLPMPAKQFRQAGHAVWEIFLREFLLTYSA
jgi:hypothetical protein